jgi:23S rRNA pseudouridine2457 synthase
VIVGFKYLLFNKPYGVLSQFTDEGTGHPTLKKYINIPEVYAAGRLDRDSEGLLILTNDGRLISHLSDPVHHVLKTYLVQVEGRISSEKIDALSRGITLRGYTTLPCAVRVVDEPKLPAREKPVTPHGPVSWLEIKLREGKKRQLRHMTAAVGLFTLRIIRVAIGGIGISTLLPGENRELTRVELKTLGLKKPD